ncbi:MAG TPA: helix-turn-helix domain-containing protein [Chthoniobacterales bacterium]
MPRPVSIQDDVILRAAREIFLEKGSNATTSEIAAKAGVSHGIIFKRFKTKRALFQCAMQDQSDWGQAIPTLLNCSLGRKDVETTLVELGTLFVEKFLMLIPTLMMAWSNKQETESPAESAAAANKERATKALQSVKTIATYLEAEHRLGRIRETDFEVVAQAFVGALWHHAFLQVMLTDGKSGPSKERRYVKRLVKTMWSGIAPQ